MLEIKDLTIQYGDKLPVVENFSLSLKKGEIITIVGESGSGKSTVLSSILGLLPNGGKIISGDIIYNGESMLNKSLNQWRELRGTEITMISQDSGGTLNPIRKIGKQFVLSHLHGYLQMALSGKVGKDFKTLLQELVQQNGECVIRYHVIDEEGPDHNKFFTMEVVIDGVPSGVGSGRNKKIAAQAAAKEAYEKLIQQ